MTSPGSSPTRLCRGRMLYLVTFHKDRPGACRPSAVPSSALTSVVVVQPWCAGRSLLYLVDQKGRIAHVPPRHQLWHLCCCWLQTDGCMRHPWVPYAYVTRYLVFVALVMMPNRFFFCCFFGGGYCKWMRPLILKVNCCDPGSSSWILWDCGFESAEHRGLGSSWREERTDTADALRAADHSVRLAPYIEEFSVESKPYQSARTLCHAHNTLVL